MSNTIRRSDAIDALIKAYTYIDPCSFTDVIMGVEDAPAHPNVHDLPKDADCISRQAAIDELQKRSDASKKLGHNGKLGMDTVRHYLRLLPPAQQWIPVTERLSERGKTILCCNKHGSVFASALTFLQIRENRSVYAHFG